MGGSHSLCCIKKHLHVVFKRGKGTSCTRHDLGQQLLWTSSLSFQAWPTLNASDARNSKGANQKMIAYFAAKPTLSNTGSWWLNIWILHSVLTDAGNGVPILLLIHMLILLKFTELTDTQDKHFLFFCFKFDLSVSQNTPLIISLMKHKLRKGHTYHHSKLPILPGPWGILNVFSLIFSFTTPLKVRYPVLLYSFP